MATTGLEELQALAVDTRRRRGPRRAPGNQRRGAGQAGRGSAGRAAGQRRADVGDSEGRERHPHRAVREGAARPVPHRRDSLQHHEPADEVPRRDLLAHQDHGEARHRREAPAAGRPHQDPLQRQRHAEGNRLPRVGAADALRREDRHASARQGQADARHDEARLRARVARQVRAGDSASVGHGARHGPDRQRQDQHALFVDLEDQHAGNQHHDGGGPGRVQPRRRQPGAGARERSASTSRPRCAPSCGRTRTSSSSAKSATSKRRKSRSRPRSRATSCSRRCTPTTRRARSTV